MRPGAEFFTTPGSPAQCRYEALRAYLVDGLPAVVGITEVSPDSITEIPHP